MFQGYRTYMTAGLIVLVQFGVAVGAVPADGAAPLTNLLIGMGLAFLRASVANK